MNKTGHTPGPWTVEEYGDDETPSLVIHRDSENRICFMARPGSHGDPAKIETDARLIAASPDLLASLSEIVKFCDDPYGSVKPESLAIGLARTLPSARAAISRATGSAP